MTATIRRGAPRTHDHVRRAAAGSTEPRGVARRLGDAVLYLTGTLGVLVVAWLIFAAVTGATLVVFKTGSMAPTMPTGAVALSMPATASELRVGDVITARSDDATLPVTHRIVSIKPGPRAGTRVVTLRGDDNAEPDLFPYTVGTVPRVVFAVPGLAPVFAALHSRVVTLGITVLAAGVVLFVLWPRRGRGARGRDATGEASTRE